jgi:RNA polymerase sigma-70 factor (ECF subfamily)
MDREENPRIDVEAYYRRYGPMVWRRCLRMLRNEEAALDALQEVFVKLMIYRDSLKGTSPSSLLYRMATNLCLNKIRDQRRQGRRESLDLAGGRSSGLSREQSLDLQMALEAILEDEEESTRQMAFLYFVDGFNLKEVSVEMEMSVAGVHRRLKHLRRRLKRLKQCI